MLGDRSETSRKNSATQSMLCPGNPLKEIFLFTEYFYIFNALTHTSSPQMMCWCVVDPKTKVKTS
jgi:hypothetical protein